MNKDFDLKNDPRYSSEPLRRRIQTQVKEVRDTGDELDQPAGKRLPVIPVTGMGRAYKYFNNKSPRSY